jgi:hypothetical protein
MRLYIPLRLTREGSIGKKDKRLDDIVAELMGVTARIVQAPDAGQLRLIINGRAIKMTGRYPCYKAQGRSLAYEADHENALMEISDADQAVLRCMAQPHRVIIPMKGRDRNLEYIPDLRRDLADGSVEIIETKADDDRRMRDPDYLMKLDLAERVYRIVGWSFRKLSRKQIMASELYRNAHSIVTWAYCDVPPAQLWALRTALRQAGDALPYAKAAEIVGGEPCLSALIVQRKITFDLTARISNETAVTWVDHEVLRSSSKPFI